MALTFTHPFVSAKADGADATLVQPSNWNANHLLAGGAKGDLLVLDATQATGVNNVAAVAAGAYLRSNGVTTIPIWSTLILPNAATQGDLLIATGANTIGSLADVAVGQVLVSGGGGAAPAWSASPTLILPALGTTSTDGLVLLNNTASTAGVPVQMSPRFRQGGTAYNSVSTLSETNSFFTEVLPATAAGTTSATWKLGYINPSGVVTYPFQGSSAGQWTASTSISSPQVLSPVGQNLDFGANGVGSLWRLSTSGHLLAVTDNTYDIGAVGATRPRNVYVAGNTIAGNVYVGPSGGFAWGNGATSLMLSPSDGVIRLANNAGTGFTRLILGTNDATANGISITNNGGSAQIGTGDGSSVRDLIVRGLTTNTGLSVGTTVTSVNGITTAGNGVPLIVATPYETTGNTGAVTNAINYTPAAVSGTYELIGVVNVTAWTTPATFSVVATYKDASGNARTDTAMVVRGSTGANAAAVTAVDRWYFTFPAIDIDATATAITLSTTGTFTGSPVYNLQATLRRNR